MQINNYGIGANYSATGAQRTNKQELGVNDFMTLLATQLSNQDIMNPSGDTEFIAQMAQFTSLKAMQSVADMTQTQYAASLVGKKVIVADLDRHDNLNTDTGCVDKVKFVDGQSVIEVNGKEYALSSIMEVLSENVKTETK